MTYSAKSLYHLTIAFGLISVLFFCACKKKEEQVKTYTTRYPAPESLVLKIGIRSFNSSLDRILDYATELFGEKLDRDSLYVKVISLTHFDKRLINSVNLNSSFWILRFDGPKLKEKIPSVLVVPLKSVDLFKTEILRIAKREKNQGLGLDLYLPKDQRVKPFLMHIYKKWAIIPSSKTLYELNKGYILSNLVNEKIDHDLVAELNTNTLFDVSADEFSKRLKQSLNKMANNPRFAPILSSIKDMYQLLKGTKKITFDLDLTKEEMSVSSLIEFKKNVLKIKNTQPAFALDHFPQTTWFVMTQNQPLSDKIPNMAMLYFQSIASELPQDIGNRLIDNVENLRQALGESYSYGLYRSKPQGQSFAFYSKVRSKEKALLAIKKIEETLETWSKGHSEPNAKLKIERNEIDPSTRVYDISLPSNETKEQRRIDLLLGRPIQLAWTVNEKYAALIIGNKAKEDILKTDMQDTLAQYPAFKHAQSKSLNGGMLYFSLVDMIRGLSDCGFTTIEPLAKILKDTKISNAPNLSWGSDKKNKLKLKLQIPIKHFNPFKIYLKLLTRPYLT